MSADGTARCWGDNRVGQLGNGTSIDGLKPVAVAGLSSGTGAVALISGDEHSSALMANGTVKCWGENAGGQLGNGALIDSPFAVSAKGVANVIAVAAGGADTRAVAANGTVQCWGANSHGELGNGTTASLTVPIVVRGVGGAGRVERSESDQRRRRPLVRIDDDRRGDLLGRQHRGRARQREHRLVDPADDRERRRRHGAVEPAAIVVSAGGDHSCALIVGGLVRCWGNNTNGAVGSGQQESARNGAARST